MRVLIACEFNGGVRDAFRSMGHDAWSCDLLPAMGSSSYHIQGDMFRAIASRSWDILIVHPACTYLTSSAEWAYADFPMINGKPRNTRQGTLIGAARRAARELALDDVRRLMGADVDKIAVENPVGKIGTVIRPADQWIQPNEFGHDASKNTGLWLKNLPPLVPTKIIKPRIVNGRPRWGNQTDSGQNRESPSPDRWKTRSKTYQGIADAMANQWG